MKVINDITYFKENKLDIYLPDKNCFSTVIYFHGGGIVGGDKQEYREHGEFLAERGICFVSANYSLYPNTEFPLFIEDAAECVNWVYSNIKNYGKCNNFYIGGSSAGAFISLMLCFDGKYLKAHNIENVKGYIHNAGQPTAHFNVLKYSGYDSRRVIVDETAPLYYVGTTDLNQNMLIMFSDKDMENRYEQSQLLLSTLKHFNYINIKHKIFENTGHCEQDFAHCENGDNVLAKTIYDYVAEIEGKL